MEDVWCRGWYLRTKGEGDNVPCVHVSVRSAAIAAPPVTTASLGGVGMRVSVVGSWSDHTPDKGWELVHREGLAAACRELGLAIVQQGHRLVAGSDKPHTADFHAVEGALGAPA